MISELYTEESEEGLIDIIGDSSTTDDCKTTYKAYIGYAKEIENSKLEFHKYNVSDGVEKDNVWDIDINEKNEYTIGYNPKSKKHMIRSEKIRPEIISTLKRTFV